MSELQRWDREGHLPEESSPDRLPDRRRDPRLPAVDRNRSRGLDLSPAEVVARRSNRRWMLFMVVSSVVILVLALIATAVFVSNEPSGPKISVPVGYQAINDGYFSYAVPQAWKNNPSNTDQAGDVDTSGPTGFAGEHIAYRASAPVLGATPPVALEALGASKPTPFELTGGRPVVIAGTSAAFVYTATRPGGFQATVVNAYDYKAAVELWLMIQAPPSVTGTIVSSLRA
ncbi:MAG: hypothetical protein KGQ66_02480 [Acidobacteriota bacterium]|nr:hypothetical protein [Acidobacteriota bacterium]